ncbi:MAG: Dabb family protein [Nitrospiria bacterium]
MIKHIVLWKLKEEADGHHKDENARKVKEILEGLNGKIEGLLHLEVGIDLSKAESSSDLSLYSEFGNRENLEFYRNHPEHKAVLPFLQSICIERRVVDYEV